MPEGGGPQYMLRFPDRRMAGPLSVEKIMELNAQGGLPASSLVKRLPDGAWMAVHSVFRHLAPPDEELVPKPKAAPKPPPDRRHEEKALVLVDRRKGKAFVLGEIGFLALLLGILAFLLLK